MIFIFATSCEDEHFSAIPDLSFRRTFLLDEKEFFGFDIGTSIALDNRAGGYAGLILYYFAENEIRAFDRCCPIHVTEKEHLLIDGALAMCPKDSAYFSLLDTPPIEIGSKTPSIMRTYLCYKSGNTISVYN